MRIVPAIFLKIKAFFVHVHAYNETIRKLLGAQTEKEKNKLHNSRNAARPMAPQQRLSSHANAKGAGR